MYGCQIRPEIDTMISELADAILHDDLVYGFGLLRLLEHRRDCNRLSSDEAYFCLGTILGGVPITRHLSNDLQAAHEDWRRFLHDHRGELGDIEALCEPVLQQLVKVPPALYA